MNNKQMTDWVAAAETGDTMVYFTGFMGMDWGRNKARDMAQTLEANGKVNLFQEKQCAYVYKYFMQKTSGGRAPRSILPAQKYKIETSKNKRHAHV